MGWGRGSEVADEVWSIVKPYIAPSEQRFVAKELIALFEAHDCDTLQDAEELWDDAGKNEEAAPS